MSEEAAAAARGVGLRYAYRNLGKSAGYEFASELLCAGDFGSALIAKFGEGNVKSQQAAAIARWILAEDEALDMHEFALAFARQTREWLSFRSGLNVDLSSLPELGDPKAFFTQMDAGSEWVGPFWRDDGDEAYYLSARIAHSWIKEADGKAPKSVEIRWHVVAQVRADVVSFHWNNLSHIETPEEAASGRTPIPYAYAKVVPQLMDGFLKTLGTGLSPDEVTLSEIVLHRAFDQYFDNDEYHWDHRNIRAAGGDLAVNLNASRANKSGVVSYKVGPIEALAGKMARLAAEEFGVASPSKLNDAKRAILTHLLTGLGPLSYSCKISSKRAVQVIFSGYVHFGNRPHALGTVDCFPHVHCAKRYGGSNAALKFLTTYL
ncbi:MAG TPA: hypothetical protein VLC09_20155 [Polyangiaceae bacterium]|nr:hypothetical protein [Polyangiaceae bacterium]